MKYTYLLNTENNYCSVIVTGDYKRPHDAFELQTFSKYYEIETNCSKFLYDFREANIIGDIMETYEVGLMILDPQRKQINQLVATVYNNSNSNLNKHYLEKVAVKEGYQFKVFDDIELAKEWLSN